MSVCVGECICVRSIAIFVGIFLWKCFYCEDILKVPTVTEDISRNDTLHCVCDQSEGVGMLGLKRDGSDLLGPMAWPMT